MDTGDYRRSSSHANPRHEITYNYHKPSYSNQHSAQNRNGSRRSVQQAQPTERQSRRDRYAKEKDKRGNSMVRGCGSEANVPLRRMACNRSSSVFSRGDAIVLEDMVEGNIKADLIKHHAMLGHFMCALWQRGRFFDVTIKIGREDFPAHRIVLMAHSSFFQAKLGSRKFDCIKLEVRLDPLGISTKTFQAVLTFIYQGQTVVSGYEDAAQCVRASRILGIADLASAVENYMWGCLIDNPSANTFEMIRCCHKFGLQDLKFMALQNYAEKWGTITEDKMFLFLPAEDVRCVLDNDKVFLKSEVDIFRAILRWIDFDILDREKDANLMELVLFSQLSPRAIKECTMLLNEYSNHFPSHLYHYIFGLLKSAHWDASCQELYGGRGHIETPVKRRGGVDVNV